jgi:putative oxidoreductase
LDIVDELFTENLGIPEFFAVLVILAKFLGGPGLIIGLLSRVAALGIGIEMIVAVALVHLPNGFFMNWFSTQQGEGFEYHLLAISMAAVIAFRWAGALSMDRALENWFSRGRRIPMGTPHVQPT